MKKKKKLHACNSLSIPNLNFSRRYFRADRSFLICMIALMLLSVSCVIGTTSHMFAGCDLYSTAVVGETKPQVGHYQVLISCYHQVCVIVLHIEPLFLPVKNPAQPVSVPILQPWTDTSSVGHKKIELRHIRHPTSVHCSRSGRS